MANPNTFAATDLSCIRGENQLFSDLQMHVQSGQCLHVIGANGSGKTSLLKILCGLARPESGRLSWNGSTLSKSDSYWNDSAYIGHKDGLKNELSAIENLRFSQRLEGLKDEQRLDHCLARLDILNCADRLAQNLSFGQRRRLSFSKLLLRSYSLWILDEPFTGIDAKGRELIESLCMNHLDSGGIIVLTNHQSLQTSSLSQYLNELVLDQLSGEAGANDE